MSRQLNSISEDSETSDFSLVLPYAADRADDLVRGLADVKLDANPQERLQGFMCVRSIVSTTSPFAERHDVAVKNVDLQAYEEIGKGYTGIVFERQGVNEIIKMAIKDGDLSANLWNDFQTGTMVWEKINEAGAHLSRQQRLPRTPRYHSYYSSKHDVHKIWWKQNEANFPERHRQPRSFLIAERVLPLPKPVRDGLIDAYCPERGRAGAKASPCNKNCLARLYLGRSRTNAGGGSFFSLKNFPIHQDQAFDICTLDDVLRFAREMAGALAVLHWSCEVDANDVEFVLGSAPTLANFPAPTSTALKALPAESSITPYHNFKKRAVHLWIIDFDKVKPMELNEAGVKQAIVAAEENDPYFPKPVKSSDAYGWRLWKAFAEEYMAVSKEIIEWKGHENCGELPLAFIHGWHDYRLEKVEQRGGREG